jgi:hypothetical protein
MLDLLSAAIQTTPDIFKSRDVLLLENLALGQQLAVLLRKHPRPRVKNSDRLFWVTLSRLWKQWRDADSLFVAHQDQNSVIGLKIWKKNRRFKS